MVHFVYQLYWTTEGLDILGVSVRMFLDEINMCIGRLSKAECPPYCG